MKVRDKHLGYHEMRYHVYEMPATIPTVDKLCYSHGYESASFTEVVVVAKDTKNDSKE